MGIEHTNPEDPDMASHFEWEFRNEAYIWNADDIVGINFHPTATEFQKWLKQEGNFSVFSERTAEDAFTNPHTYQASALAGVMSHVINDSHSISTSQEPIDALDAEIQRIQSYNELVLYVARLCEALIKQLAFCTQIPKHYYFKASLGALLATDCKECRREKKPAHKISILGSLAHRYGHCLKYEHCLKDHLRIAGRCRNGEAAHSGIPDLQIRTAIESRSKLHHDAYEIGTDLVHMLEHISELEIEMKSELERRARRKTLGKLIFLPGKGIRLEIDAEKEANG
ncbi:hypothetical protein H6F95_12635 [Cyanobacteria bacterium FACHB-471]|nr:hypothetical protein [Cyanobacteria bacterium FACHB-471]